MAEKRLLETRVWETAKGAIHQQLFLG